MKKLLAITLALALTLSVSACGSFVSIMPGTELPDGVAGGETAEPGEDSFTQQPLFAFMGWESFGESYYSDTPVALAYQTEAGEDGVRGCRAYVFDRASIIAACDALRGVTVTGRSEESPTGAEFTLIMADGTEYALSFSLAADGFTRVLRTYTGSYTVSGGDGLWDIQFPSYSADFDIFDLYFDDAVRAFADNFYEETPVSVGYRMNSGATLTSDDPDTVRSVFEVLAHATISRVENQPDQNIDVTQVRDYVFTMADGTSYAFTFAQQCLAVTANAGFGTVYYWLDNISALWEIAISSKTEEVFAGGTVASLRDDMEQTAEIAGGQRDDLSIVSVFVDYAIGDQTGYLALEGEEAAELVRAVTAVSVSSEVESDPQGDRLNISVTLSDATGPIFYFTGDAIQQTVGTNYVCDSDQMSALRGTILELAADGSNAAEVEGEEGTE